MSVGLPDSFQLVSFGHVLSMIGYLHEVWPVIGSVEKVEIKLRYPVVAIQLVKLVVIFDCCCRFVLIKELASAAALLYTAEVNAQ